MSKVVQKLIVLCCILAVSMFSLSGCYTMQNLDDLAFVVALGIDIGENDELKLSFQIAIPSSSGGGGEGR